MKRNWQRQTPLGVGGQSLFPSPIFPVRFILFLEKKVFRCFCWWKNLEGNSRVAWTRQNLFWENVSRTRLRSSFPPPHPRSLPPLTNMTLKEQEEEEQTLRTNQVYRLVSMEWLEYIRRVGRKRRGRRRDVASFVRRLLSLSTSLRDAIVRAGFRSFSLRAAWIWFRYVVARGGWKKTWGACPARQSSSTKDKWFRALGRLTWNALRNLMMTDRTGTIPCRFGAARKLSEGVGHAEPRHK